MRRSGPALLSMGCVVLACKMDNPAFGEQVGSRGVESDESVGDDTMAKETSESHTGAEASSSSSSSESTGDGDGDSSSADNGEDDVSSDESGDGDGDACDLPIHESLSFRVPLETSNTACPETYTRDMLVVGPGPNGGILAQACAEGCNSCSGSNLELEAWPYPIDDIAEVALSECIHVDFEVFVAANSDWCEYGRVRVGYYEDPSLNAPLLIGSSVDKAAPEFVGDFLNSLGLLPWSLTTSQSCVCPPRDADPCCLPADPPSIYQLQLGQLGQLEPQESLEFSLGRASYLFTLWQAQQVDSCGAQLEISWLAHPQ